MDLSAEGVMMLAFIAAILFTLGVSAFCSLLEAIVLSTTTSEIENLKQKHQRMGEMFEQYKTDIEETSSAILALNTIANTCGATLVGGLAVQMYHDHNNVLEYVSLSMAVGILIFSEIIPKNIGVIYRTSLHSWIIYPLWCVRIIMYPLSTMGKWFVRLFVKRRNITESGETEIILLAEKGAKEGTLTNDESTMISNTLKLDDIAVKDIMTPRTVVTAFDQELTLDKVFEAYPNIPHARLPVYDDSIDHVVGMVRRRDLLKAIAEDEHSRRVKDLMQEIVFIPETASGTSALQQFLSTHQQLAVVVDEFGSVAGVLTMEDVIEHILGQEIFEKDDMAIDMRELARKKKLSNGNTLYSGQQKMS